MRVSVLDLFSAAAGGWSLGMHRAGFETMAACEAIDWRRHLYAQNNPGIRIYDDVRTLTAARLLSDIGFLPDIVVGSPPCQDISSANTKGKGVDGERSGLFFEAVRIIGECRPRWFALENSANLRTRGADRVIAALAGVGYTCWAFVVGADDVGANHERKRSWLLGRDLDQTAHAGSWEQRLESGRWHGANGAHPARHEDYDPTIAFDAEGIRHEGGRSWRYGADGNRAASIACCGDARNADQQPCAARLGFAAGEGSGDIGGGSVGPGAECGGDCPLHAADMSSIGCESRAGDCQSNTARRDGGFTGDDTGDGRARNAPHPDQAGQAGQAGQADGCMEPSLRQAEISDGCRDGRCDDGPGGRQMGLCAPDSGGTDGAWPLWSLADLAGRVRLDDGLPARVAGTRVAVGGPRGTSAASLIVEAYGDAVLPQIPEAIGRAILRTEAALRAVYAS